jgi:hypothetical protein
MKSTQPFGPICRRLGRVISVNSNPQTPGDRPAQTQFDFDAEPDFASADLETEDRKFYLARMRESLQVAGAKPHDMRTPCTHCGFTLGVLRVVGHQNTVRCARCDQHSYNAPKWETGDGQRKVKTLRRHMTPSQQARILERDHGRCILCGGSEDLTIGHLLSIADGTALGALESEMNDDANLAAMCEGCNAGLGKRSVSTRTYLLITLRILQAEIRRVGPRR